MNNTLYYGDNACPGRLTILREHVPSCSNEFIRSQRHEGMNSSLQEAAWMIPKPHICTIKELLESSDSAGPHEFKFQRGYWLKSRRKPQRDAAMNPHKQLLPIACMSIVMFWIGAFPTNGQVPAPKNKERVHGPSEEAYEDRSSLPYEYLVTKYLASIDEIVRRRYAVVVRGNQQDVERYRQVDNILLKTKSQVLSKLRSEHSKRHGRRLFDWDGDAYERTIISPSSPTSAEIFHRLYQDDLLDLHQILLSLEDNPQLLCQAWVAFINEIREKAVPKSFTWNAAIRLSYQCGGIQRKKYRRQMEEMAAVGASMLDALFFENDVKTGLPKPVITSENLALLKRLAGKEYPPEVRAKCADFAVTIRDYDLAQSICSDLMSQTYKGLELGLEYTRPPEEDGPLYRAKVSAMATMFFKLRNECMFKLIYDRSRIVETEARDNAGKPLESWISILSYPRAQLEIGEAAGYISKIADLSDDKVQ